MGAARLRAAVAVIGWAAASGCSGSATLELRDGSEMKGRIMRSDANTVFLEPEDEGAAESPQGRERSVERERIADVSHPGAWEMALGLPTAGLGVFVMAVVPPTTATCTPSHDCEEPGGVNPVFVLGALLAAVGVGLEVGGLSTWESSRSRYARPATAAP